MKPHAFIAMPFGTKPGHDGQPIDFDRVYAELIKPALEAAGWEVFRADEELRAGDIRTDMFQELLVADLVVADLTLDNPNVWYELGVRHALRARGVVLVQGPRPTQPFDIYTDRKLNYRLKDGAPDAAHLQADRDVLAGMARATLEAATARPVSPVYALLDHLREPSWRELLLAERNEFSQAYEAWRSRMEIARQKNRPGDILVLADETPTRALWLEAKRAAANSLLKLRQFDFALEQFEAALAIDPDDKASREKRVICLGRLGRFEEAREGVRLADRGLSPRPRGLGAGRPRREGRLDQPLAARRRHAGADAGRGRGRGGEPAGGDRAVPQGLHHRSIPLLLRHQLAHAARAAEAPGRRTGPDRRRQPDRRRALGQPDRPEARPQGLLGARELRGAVPARQSEGSRDPRVPRRGGRGQPRLVRARLHAPDADAAARPGVSPRRDRRGAGDRGARDRAREPAVPAAAGVPVLRPHGRRARPRDARAFRPTRSRSPRRRSPRRSTSSVRARATSP